MIFHDDELLLCSHYDNQNNFRIISRLFDILDYNDHANNEWMPVYSKYPKKPNYYPPPPPPPAAVQPIRHEAPTNPSSSHYNSSPSKPSYYRKPLAHHNGYGSSHSSRRRRPIQFEGTRKRPHPTIRPFHRGRWQKNPLLAIGNRLNLNRFRFQNLFG